MPRPKSPFEQVNDLFAMIDAGSVLHVQARPAFPSESSVPSTVLLLRKNCETECRQITGCEFRIFCTLVFVGALNRCKNHRVSRVGIFLTITPKQSVNAEASAA